MSAAILSIGQAVRGRRRLFIGIVVGFMLAYYAGLLLWLVLRFGEVPNYITYYNYPANVLRIVQSTPAVGDMLPIIQDEWLLEVGYINYDYGRGIAEWSLELLPSKLVVLLAMAALLATNVVLLLARNESCPASARRTGATGTGLGAGLVGFANITMTWVVCCATPSWVVGLSMLGLGAETSLDLLPYGDWLSGGGFLMLLAATLLLLRPPRRRRRRSPPALAAGTAT